jgi:hypothetical protein
MAQLIILFAKKMHKAASFSCLHRERGNNKTFANSSAQLPITAEQQPPPPLLCDSLKLRLLSL